VKKLLISIIVLVCVFTAGRFLDDLPGVKNSKVLKMFLKKDEVSDTKSKNLQPVKRKEKKVTYTIAQLQAALTKKDYKKAKVIALYFYKLNPNKIELLNNLAFACKQLKQVSEAREYYLLALNIKNDDIVVLNNIARLEHEEENYEKAEEYYKRAIALKNDFGEVILNLADMYEKMGAYELSQEYLYHYKKYAVDKAKLRKLVLEKISVLQPFVSAQKEDGLEL